MFRPAKFALRFVMIVAVVGTIAMLSGTPGTGPSPYVSALSNAVAAPTFAATCQFKSCSGGSRFNLRCDKTTARINCSVFHGTCVGGSC